ncbi:MAG: hypothetical protein E7345_04420 [Clostridiales bacterium]|nr:hypothetical protein [Clostridiales bacterium]
MEKIAVIEIKTTSVKLQIVNVARNKYFEIDKVLEMPINLTKDFYSDMFIKPNVIKEINDILSVYGKIIEQNECTENLCFVSDILNEAKNINGVLNELYVTNGFKFSVMNAEEEITSIYTAVINSFNRPKGVIVNISDYNTELMIYNRRNIIKTVILPFGSINLTENLNDCSLDDKIVELTDCVKKSLEENAFLEDIPEEFDIIGSGDIFKYYGVVCRKAKKYPLDIAHNFVSNKADVNKVFNLVKNIDTKTATKIKGIPLHDSRYFPAGMVILKAILDNFEKEEFAISQLGKVEGKLFNLVIPLTIEKPLSDTLGYSLQLINDFYDRKPNNSQHIYELSMILFKQLKVLHKLPRTYVKVLRIASYLSNSGYRVDVNTADKIAGEIIKNSSIFGVSHNDIILAGFVASCKNSDNFNLADWVRYKEYVTEEDLVAVRKLAVVLKLAEALDVTGFGFVTDITCDILGDSVIMKTITSADASFEINYSMLCGVEFKKIFGKNLEVL